MSTGNLVEPLYGETVQVVRRPVRDVKTGNRPAATGPALPVDGCVIWQPSPSEEAVFRSQQLQVDLVVLAPHDADVLATDQLQLRGDLHEVVGTPTLHRSALTGQFGGLEIHLRRVTG